MVFGLPESDKSTIELRKNEGQSKLVDCIMPLCCGL